MHIPRGGRNDQLQGGSIPVLVTFFSAGDVAVHPQPRDIIGVVCSPRLHKNVSPAMAAQGTVVIKNWGS